MRITPVTAPKNDATVLLRLPTELKAALTKSAYVHGRRITAEINMRLFDSFKGEPGFEDLLSPGARDSGQARTPQPVGMHVVREPGPQYAGSLTPAQLAMLDVFDRLPPEKQLALISLFK